MVVQDQIDRLKANVQMTYGELELLGAEIPDKKSSDALPYTAQTVPAVLYKTQNKTSAEKAQARANIGIETGTWTASPSIGTISAQHCTYMRIGNMCMLSFEIEGTGDSSTALGTTTYTKFTGLPFAPAANARWYAGGGHAQGLGISSGQYFSGYNVQPTDSTLYVRTTNATGGGGYAYLANGAKAFYLAGSVTYPIQE